MCSCLRLGYQSCSDIVQLVGNEPSIGLYFVSEHVRGAVPKIVDVRKELKKHSLQEIK
jgi:hypothetical protein